MCLLAWWQSLRLFSSHFEVLAFKTQLSPCHVCSVMNYLFSASVMKNAHTSSHTYQCAPVHVSSKHVGYFKHVYSMSVMLWFNTVQFPLLIYTVSYLCSFNMVNSWSHQTMFICKLLLSCFNYHTVKYCYFRPDDLTLLLCSLILIELLEWSTGQCRPVRWQVFH